MKTKKIQGKPESASLNITGIMIRKLSEDKFRTLDDRWSIARYSMPKGLYHRQADRNNFAEIHTSYKEHIDLPFYFYTYDKPEPALYVLVDKDAGMSAPAWNLTVGGTNSKQRTTRLTPTVVRSGDIDIHILIKLLAAKYFYDVNGKKEHICQSAFYGIGKATANFITTAKLSLQHHGPTPDQLWEEFHIEPKPQLFKKVKLDKDKDAIFQDKDKKSMNECFEEVLKDGPVAYLRQLKPSAARQRLNTSAAALYIKSHPGKGRKTQMDWHSDTSDLKGYRRTKGFIVYNFQRSFIQFLRNYGVMAEAKTLDCVRHADKYDRSSLPVEEMGTIRIYDNRFKDGTGKLLSAISADDWRRYCRKVLDKDLPDIDFTIAGDEGFSARDNPGPVLVLQDYTKEDFQEEGLLKKAGYVEDPKRILYASEGFRDLPKQSLNINVHTLKNFKKKTLEEYFNYELSMLNPDEEKEKIRVCLNELFLKDTIINKKDPTRLPGFSEWKDFCFIWQNVLMYTENNELRFINSAKPGRQEARDALLADKFGVDWGDDVVANYYEKSPRKGSGINRAYFIVGKGMVIEIEDLENHRVLPAYEIIAAKKRAGIKSARTKECIRGLLGIWYHEPGMLYTVGRKNSLKQNIPRANGFRKINVYKGEGLFDRDGFLRMLTVDFVRNKQYTVYPYPFDLVRLYCDINDII